MSVYSLILTIFSLISLFSASLILAACVTSSRSQQVVARHSAHFMANKSFEALAVDLRKSKSIANRNPLASSH